MKLQLTNVQIGDCAARLGRRDPATVTEDVIRDDAHRVLKILRDINVDPFTRKDVVAVLVGAGHDSNRLEKDSGSYAAVTNVISANATQAFNSSGEPLRGYYTQDKKNPAPARPAASPTPTPSPEMLPRPTDEEILVEVRAVPGLSLADLGDLGGDSLNQPEAAAKAMTLYEGDVGLRRLAVAKSACFGIAFDATEVVCQGCPLAKRCARDSFSFYGSVASDLDNATERAIETAVETERRRQAEVAARAAEAKRREEEAARRAAMPSPAAAPSTPTPSAPPPSMGAPLPSGPLTPGSLTEEQASAAIAKKFGKDKNSVIKIPFQGLCSLCKQPVPKGALGMHLPKVGMVHVECALAPNVAAE